MRSIRRLHGYSPDADHLDADVDAEGALEGGALPPAFLVFTGVHSKREGDLLAVTAREETDLRYLVSYIVHAHEVEAYFVQHSGQRASDVCEAPCSAKVMDSASRERTSAAREPERSSQM